MCYIAILFALFLIFFSLWQYQKRLTSTDSEQEFISACQRMINAIDMFYITETDGIESLFYGYKGRIKSDILYEYINRVYNHFYETQLRRLAK